MKVEDVAVVVQDNVPNQFKVSIGSKCMLMPIDSIVASMANQLATKIANNNPSMQFSDLYNIYYNEVSDFVSDFYHKNPDAVLNLFDEEWEEAYHHFKFEQNTPYFKDLIVTFPDGSEWSVRLMEIACLYAEKVCGLKEDEISDDFFKIRDDSLQNPDMLLEWASENISWDEIQDMVEEIKRPQPELNYASYWKASPKRIETWSNMEIYEDIELDIDKDELS